MDLKLLVHDPWEVLSSPTPQESPAASTDNADIHDVDLRKPVLVPVKKLYLEPDQELAIKQLYTDNREYRMRFNTTTESQTDAEQVLRGNGLLQAAQPQNKLENHWLTTWSSTWGSKKGVKKRGLFQCSSGYSTAARQARDKRGSQNPIEWSRQADHEFTGCLAHADVTWNRTSGQIERIIGYFEHSEKCEAVTVTPSAFIQR